jgi:hypothetical protein
VRVRDGRRARNGNAIACGHEAEIDGRRRPPTLLAARLLAAKPARLPSKPIVIKASAQRKSISPIQTMMLFLDLAIFRH